MLKQHKNRWLEIIKGYDIDPSKIEALERDDGVFVIQMQNSPFVFMLR